MDVFVDAVSGALGDRPTAVGRVSGGDTAAAYRFQFEGGRTVFAKTHGAPPPGFFTREASDLEWLRAADALPVPTVLAVSDAPVAFLALQWIDAGPRGGADDADFGRRLATLHRAGAAAFGRQDGHTTGSLGLPNGPTDDWAEFFAARRLLPLVRIAHDRSALPETTIRRVEQVAGRLAELGGPPEPPARLHGDLWAGNRMVEDTGTSWLIDPAAHGGHREFDLAMMRLFGGYDPTAFDAYHEAFPLADGWALRTPLHQLAPLIVHAIKFGGGYVGAVSDTLDALD